MLLAKANTIIMIINSRWVKEIKYFVKLKERIVAIHIGTESKAKIGYNKQNVKNITVYSSDSHFV